MILNVSNNDANSQLLTEYFCRKFNGGKKCQAETTEYRMKETTAAGLSLVSSTEHISAAGLSLLSSTEHISADM